MVDVKRSKWYMLLGALLTGVWGAMLLAVVVVSAMPATAGAEPVAGPAKAPVAPQQDGDLDCADFDSQAAAQREFDSDPSDPHRLDADNDGRACEEPPGGNGNGNGNGPTESPESPDSTSGTDDGTDSELPVTGRDLTSPGLLALLGSVALTSGIWLVWRYRRRAGA